MKMIRQYNPRVNVKRLFAFYYPNAFAQYINVLYEQVTFTFKQIDRKK